MKVEPTFCGKIHVTTVKNNKWFWYDYQTSLLNDKKILKLAKSICPKRYTWNREPISEKNGELLRSTIEEAIGEKLDIPQNSVYSATLSKSYNPLNKKDSHSILLFCQEKFSNDISYAGDRTAIDIYI